MTTDTICLVTHKRRSSIGCRLTTLCISKMTTLSRLTHLTIMPKPYPLAPCQTSCKALALMATLISMTSMLWISSPRASTRAVRAWRTMLSRQFTFLNHLVKSSFSLKVWATTTVSKLKSAIVQRIKSKNANSTMTESNFKLSCNQARMPNEQTMADFSDDKSGVKDSMVVTRSLRIRGGGVRKPYLKDNLVAKSVSLIEKKIGPPL